MSVEMLERRVNASAKARLRYRLYLSKAGESGRGVFISLQLFLA